MARTSRLECCRSLCFWSTTAGNGRGGASSPLCFFCVQILVGFREKFFDAFAVTAVDGDADTCGKRGLLAIGGENFTDAIRNTMGIVLLGFRENEGKFVSAVTRGGINGAAMNAKNISEAADGAAADKMAVVVIDFFQAIEVEKQDGEGPAGAVSSFRFVFEDIEKAAVVGKAGERIADGEMMNLFEELRVIEKRAAESDGVTQHHERLGEEKGASSKRADCAADS